MDALDLALRLTLLDLLLQPIGDWTLRPLILALAALGLLLPGAHRQPALWLALTGLTALRVALAWPLADNHAYLLSYWCLAIFLALRGEDAEGRLAANARGLIGLAFALAVAWKLALSPDYVDQTFFRVTLIVDDRFEGLVRLLGGMTPELLEQSRLALEPHLDGPAAADAPRALLGARFLALAAFATWWTLAIETAVAAGFLWPAERGLARIGHWALLVFCVTTYAVAPVEGFGWLLLAMGAAQCARQPRVRLLYLATFALVLFYREVPWATLLADQLGR
jgi:hypothetical protein